MQPLSPRGRRLVERPSPPFIAEHFARSPHPYDASENPDGYIGLCVAENMQMWDLTGPRLAGPHDLTSRVAAYSDLTGSAAFREAIARLFERTIFDRPVDAGAIVTMAGVGAILEAVFFALAGPDDSVLVPTPSYPGFWPDLEMRDGLRVVPVHTSAVSQFQLTRELLDAAFDAAETPVRALLYTNPDNPLGRVANPADVEMVVEWCAERQLHLVVDEIYALSVFGDTAFTSVGRLHDPLGDLIHVVWGFSKDFAVGGLRCGVLVTENPEVRAAVASQAMWGSVSSLTQVVLGDLIADEQWTDGYLAETRGRLGSIHRSLTDALTAEHIPHLPADAGLFVLVDLRDFLDEATWEAEERLWRHLLDEANVNLTPGEACRISEPGFFRLCFAPVPIEASLEGVARIRAALHQQR